MKHIKQIPNDELYFNLRQLSEVAKGTSATYEVFYKKHGLN